MVQTFMPFVSPADAETIEAAGRSQVGEAHEYIEKEILGLIVALIDANELLCERIDKLEEAMEVRTW